MDFKAVDEQKQFQTDPRPKFPACLKMYLQLFIDLCLLLAAPVGVLIYIILNNN
jgi:hypothetical protein